MFISDCQMAESSILSVIGFVNRLIPLAKFTTVTFKNEFQLPRF